MGTRPGDGGAPPDGLIHTFVKYLYTNVKSA